ncbi:hypothetical protein TSMEX_005322 [Taenia solium]|eukprot:TsM_000603000 transcript=TsM_000603000 gene=TsM_000603000
MEDYRLDGFKLCTVQSGATTRRCGLATVDVPSHPVLPFRAAESAYRACGDGKGVSSVCLYALGELLF